MDTIKNFLTGVLVVVFSFILLGVVLLIWPLLIGLSSIILTILAAIAFILLIFYITVLIGYLVRSFVFRKSEK